MTTTALSPAVCPPWCETPGDCRGEHIATVGDGPVPATAGLPRFARDVNGGVYFPAITIGLSWDTVDDLQPSVSLYVGSPGDDTQADLHLHEAKLLLIELQRAIDMLEAQA